MEFDSFTVVTYQWSCAFVFLTFWIWIEFFVDCILTNEMNALNVLHLCCLLHFTTVYSGTCIYTLHCTYKIYSKRLMKNKRISLCGNIIEQVEWNQIIWFVVLQVTIHDPSTYFFLTKKSNVPWRIFYCILLDWVYVQFIQGSAFFNNSFFFQSNY